MRRTCILPALWIAAALARAAAAEPYALEPVANVPNPIFATHAGDERLFVADRSGRIWIWTESGGVATTPFLDIRAKVDSSGEGGFLSMAFHPDYASNGTFYVSYTAPSPFRSVVERYRVSADPNVADPASAATLLVLVQGNEDAAGNRIGYTNHNGGQLQFGPDGYLYAGFGDGGGAGDQACQAQQDGNAFGTLLRLDVDRNTATPPFYGIPADNPFAAPDDGIPDEIWATGLRNPWRFSFDRGTGDLYIGDVGQNAREEIDRQPASSHGGEDYGWRIMEGTSCFDADPGADADCPAGLPGCFDPSFTPPIFDYGRAQGDRTVTGGYVYRGRAIPELRGLYVFGDFASGRIWSLAQTAPGTWSRTLLLESGLGIASFGEDRSGNLYVMDLAGGRVLRLVSSAEPGGAGSIACIAALNAGFARVARVQGTIVRRCWKDAARSRPPGLLSCVEDDPQGKRARAERKTRASEDALCAEPPGFGPFDADTLNFAAAFLAPGWIQQIFGPDPEAAVLTDKAGAKCQKAALGVLLECETTRIREFNRCVNAGLRDGSIGDADALVGCLSADPRDRIARRCEAEPGEARRLLARRCAARGVTLDVAFPGCASAEPEAVAACLDRSQRCQLCLALGSADALDPDCDLFDDAAADASCP